MDNVLTYSIMNQDLREEEKEIGNGDWSDMSTLSPSGSGAHSGGPHSGSELFPEIDRLSLDSESKVEWPARMLNNDTSNRASSSSINIWIFGYSFPNPLSIRVEPRSILAQWL